MTSMSGSRVAGFLQPQLRDPAARPGGVAACLGAPLPCPAARQNLRRSAFRFYNGVMPTFIDESGDTGLVDRGGKPYFRLAAVWLPTLDHAEAFREAVRKLRQTLGIRAAYEFKFASTHSYPDRRQAFYSMALDHEFRFTVCSIDKTADYWNTASGDEQHWASATTLAVWLRDVYVEAEQTHGAPLREPVIVDDNADGSFLKIVTKAFRGLNSKNSPGISLVGAVTFRKSRAEEVLQLADMVCGAVGAHLDGNDSAWYKLIAGRNLRTFCLP